MKVENRLVAGTVVALTAVPMVALASGPAQAADTFQCSGNATVFASGTDGKLYKYMYANVGKPNPVTGGGVQVGQGWEQFPRILGGMDGRVYGLNSSGLYRFRYNGSGWDSTNGAQSKLISNSFADYATDAFRNRITVDEIGDFYTVDSAGKLRWWRYDEASSTWTVSGRVIATGWNRFDLIVATGPGVLWAREPDGDMFRHRFESTSQRWVTQDEPAGFGWQMFTKGMFSVGGDAVFGVHGNGDLFHYRYKEAPDPAFVVGGVKAGNGWAGFTNVFSLTDTCKLTERHIPPAASDSIEAYTPVAVKQGPADGTSVGPIEYVYSDNIGRLRHGFQEHPDNFSTVQWSTVPSDEAFAGKPALVVNGQNNLQALAHSINGDTWSFTRSKPNPSWQAGVDLEGAMSARPVAVRLSDGSSVTFSLDNRALWFRGQDGPTGDVLPWRQSSVRNVSGDIVTVAGADRSATVFVRDHDNLQWRSFTYRDGVLSGGSYLGWPVGTPSVVVQPGRVLRVFAQHTDASIVTQQQNADGTWPGRWQPVGTFQAQGNPAAVLEPVSGKLAVVVRGQDNELYWTAETEPGTRAWENWSRVYKDAPDPAATDPTVTEFSSGTGQSWLIATRNANNAVRVYYRVDLTNGKRAGAAPAFQRQTLPAPPR